MDLFLIQWIYFRLFIVVNQFLRKWTIRPSLPEIPVTMDIPPPPCRRRRRAALVPGPSASALACRRRRRAALVPGPSASALACRRRRRAGSRPLPVSVRPRLPSSSSSPPPPTAADAPDRPSPSRRRASFRCFVCVVISRN